MTNLPQVLIWPIKRVPVSNLKLFETIKTEFWAEEVREFSIMLYGEIGWWAFIGPPTWLPQYKRFSKL